MSCEVSVPCPYPAELCFTPKLLMQPVLSTKFSLEEKLSSLDVLLEDAEHLFFLFPYRILNSCTDLMKVSTAET